MSDPAVYDGPVCYLDDWHHTVVQDADGNDVPGDRLFLDDSDPNAPFYRLAVDGDESWHDRKHQGFILVDAVSGQTLRVSNEEMQSILAARENGGS